MQNFVGHNAIVNALGVNADNVLVSAGQSELSTMVVYSCT